MIEPGDTSHMFIVVCQNVLSFSLIVQRGNKSYRPRASFPYRSRSVLLSSFQPCILGRASTRIICLGTLYPARRILENSESSSKETSLPGSATTTATGISPLFSSGTPKTAASLTFGPDLLFLPLPIEDRSRPGSSRRGFSRSGRFHGVTGRSGQSSPRERFLHREE